MSIKNSNGPVRKRRKLSHSSGDESASEPNINSDSEVEVPTGLSRVGNVERDLPATDRPPRQSKGDDTAAMAGGVTRSSVMMLQTEELLGEIRPQNDVALKTLKPVTDELIRAIKSVPGQAPLSLLEAEKAIHKKLGGAIPFGNYAPDSAVKYKFEYRQPSKVTLRGLMVHNLGTTYRADLEVAVQMPSDLFNEKDYLNYRVFHKRAYYIAHLAAGLTEGRSRGQKYHYELQDDNDLVPVIAFQIRNPEDSDTSIKIIVNAILPPSIGPVDKLMPDRNCVRSADKTDKVNATHSAPTPFYNGTVRALASEAYADQLLEQAIQRCDAFRDACMLGHTWLQQRGFSSAVSAGGFGALEWASVCALLLSGGGHKGHPLFSDRYSSLQLFKAMLQVLAAKDLIEPLIARADKIEMPKGDFPIIYDGVSGMNLLYKVNPWSYEALRHHAKLSLVAINSRSQNYFDACFILKVDEPFLEYDELYTMTIPLSTADSSREVMLSLYNVLRKGLGDRAVLLDLKEQPKSVWSLQLPKSKGGQNQHCVKICLLINPDTTSRLIDHGPTAEQQEEAREFREFWGEKSELRRFRDGSITEALVWSSGQSVTHQIIQYLALYHFKVLPSLVESKTPSLETDFLSSSGTVSANDAFKLINNKYQELSSKLHQLEGLPLSIRSVSPSDQSLRSSSIGIPIFPSDSAPIDVLIQFDSSTRWPDHLSAIQYTKIAFLTKLSDTLAESDSSLTTRVGLENPVASDATYYNSSFLDVIYPPPAPGLSSTIFRLRIHHERELHLLQNLHGKKFSVSHIRDAVASATLHHKRMFIASPIHTTAVRNLVTHFPSLSATIRLFKSWIASHNLSNHILEPVLEIIAAHVFLHPYPWSTPSNPNAAFLRCLRLVSRWDWSSTPLIVDLSLSQDMQTNQITELETRFQAWRKLDPNMNTITWFVGTNIDNTGTIWTQDAKPARVVAGRITALAKAAMDVMKEQKTEMDVESWKSLFVSPTDDFDFVIHLKPSILRGGARQKGGKHSGDGGEKFKNLQIQEELDVDKIGYDVGALYLNDLERAFGAVALFFQGEGGRHIAGLWRPLTSGRKEWRVRLGYSTVPYAAPVSDDDSETKAASEANRQGMVAEMAMLGEGMIASIRVKD